MANPGPKGRNSMASFRTGGIGIFDSGIGGLTVLKEIAKRLPQYDYVYLGDNARAPYGTRSFETVYQYTLECVKKLFEMNCQLVILACNTASAKALRNIQQLDLEKMAPGKRVLGVIRPTSEAVGKYTQTKHVGVLGTAGTVLSDSYKIEIQKLYPDIQVFQEVCSIWVPMVEYDEIETPAADYFIKKHIDSLFSKSHKIDTVILGCTHYPLLLHKIKKFATSTPSLLPREKGVRNEVKIVVQGEIVADSLADYLKRHPEIESKISQKGNIDFYTTDSTQSFDKLAGRFWEGEIRSKHLHL